MIYYQKIYTKEEAIEYILHVWKRDPNGYEHDKIYDVLQEIRNLEDDISFEYLNELMTNIYNY